MSIIDEVSGKEILMSFIWMIFTILMVVVTIQEFTTKTIIKNNDSKKVRFLSGLFLIVFGIRIIIIGMAINFIWTVCSILLILLGVFEVMNIEKS